MYLPLMANRGWASQIPLILATMTTCVGSLRNKINTFNKSRHYDGSLYLYLRWIRSTELNLSFKKISIVSLNKSVFIGKKAIILPLRTYTGNVVVIDLYCLAHFSNFVNADRM